MSSGKSNKKKKTNLEDEKNAELVALPDVTFCYVSGDTRAAPFKRKLLIATAVWGIW